MEHSFDALFNKKLKRTVEQEIYFPESQESNVNNLPALENQSANAIQNTQFFKGFREESNSEPKPMQVQKQYKKQQKSKLQQQSQDKQLNSNNKPKGKQKNKSKVKSTKAKQKPETKHKRTILSQKLQQEQQDSLDQKQKVSRSLDIVTKCFVEMIVGKEDGLIDLNQAARLLGIHKRRIYDITNVLEGIGFIKKFQKNVVRWVGSTQDLQKDIEEGKKELEELQELERKLEKEISTVNKMMRQEFPILAKNEMEHGSFESNQSNQGLKKNNDNKNSGNMKAESNAYDESVERIKKEQKVNQYLFITHYDVQRYQEENQKKVILISVGEGGQVDIESEAYQSKIKDQKQQKIHTNRIVNQQ